MPVIFSQHNIDGRSYVDGDVISGTHLNLALDSEEPLDLVIVLAPITAETPRRGAQARASLFDQVGKSALDEKLRMVAEEWPNCDIVVLRPEPEILSVMRPNVIRAEAAVPTFVHTFGSMRTKLAKADTWATLGRHLVTERTSN